ncbi:MAG TPA: matrixin family metalloprotease [Pyrinomonadaceae bacterium]
MRRLATVFCLVAAMILSAGHVRPYTLQFTDASGSVQVRWPARTIRVSLSTSLNSAQPNIKSGSNVVGAVRRALAHWAEAANIRFEVSTSSLQSISGPGTRGDGVSLITVAHTAENSAPFIGDAAETSGRTRIFSNAKGKITEADVVLNPNQPFSADGTAGTYDLESTFTHEIGHLLGLEHSSCLGATMQPRQARNGIYNLTAFSPRTLSDDDRAGVRALYGGRPGANPRGAIAGTISFESGAPVFGANVLAEEVTTGRVVASNITMANGSYRIESLPPGDYRLIAQALNGIVPASEITSQRGAYAGLAVNQPLPFQTEELGVVSVAPNATVTLNAQLSGSTQLVTPTFIGTNRELSSVAIPIVPGQSYKVFVAGEGIKKAQLSLGGITTTSPYITVEPSSFADVDFGNGLSVVSFDLMVAADAVAGDYSLRLQSLTGEVAYIAGCLTIDASENIADADQNADMVATVPDVWSLMFDGERPQAISNTELDEAGGDDSEQNADDESLEGLKQKGASLSHVSGASSSP